MEYSGIYDKLLRQKVMTINMRKFQVRTYHNRKRTQDQGEEHIKLQRWWVHRYVLYVYYLENIK